LGSVQYELPALLALTAAGRLDPGSIVTDHFALADGADAYARFAAREDGVSKVVLDVST
jgi:threonine dehydrogenase-like Zn-dependent dehydrogenase